MEMQRATHDPADRLKINRAEFPIKGITYLVFESRMRYFLGRPKPTAGGIFPLRVGQLVSFDDWLGSVAISNVGEGWVDIDDFEFSRTIAEPLPWRCTGPDGQLQYPKTLIRITGLLQSTLEPR